MIYLEMVNSVLRRLRENEVSSVNETAYSKLVGDFINDTKREVEDAWNWIQLRSTIVVTCSVGVYAYTLTGSGNRYRVLQVLNDTQDTEMRRVPYDYMNRLFLTSGTIQTGNPEYYDLNGSSGGDVNINVWPVPNAADSLLFNMVIPQSDLSAGTDIITVPYHPVVLGAYAKAVSERGEDGSTMFAEAMNQYFNALSDAIAIDSRNVSEELVWGVC